MVSLELSTASRLYEGTELQVVLFDTLLPHLQPQDSQNEEEQVRQVLLTQRGGFLATRLKLKGSNLGLTGKINYSSKNKTSRAVVR